MNINARRHMAALGIQGKFLPMQYGGIRAVWVKSGLTGYSLRNETNSQVKISGK